MNKLGKFVLGTAAIGGIVLTQCGKTKNATETAAPALEQIYDSSSCDQVKELLEPSLEPISAPSLVEYEEDYSEEVTMLIRDLLTISHFAENEEVYVEEIINFLMKYSQSPDDCNQESLSALHFNIEAVKGDNDLMLVWEFFCSISNKKNIHYGERRWEIARKTLKKMGLEGVHPKAYEYIVYKQQQAKNYND